MRGGGGGWAAETFPFFHDLSFDLLSKWLLNLELTPSSQRHNDNGDSQNWVHSFLSLLDIDNFIYYVRKWPKTIHLLYYITIHIQFAVCIALMLFLPICIYWDRDVLICFKEVFKDPNVNLIMKQIKLQCLCSVDLAGTSSFRC